MILQACRYHPRLCPQPERVITYRTGTGESRRFDRRKERVNFSNSFGKIFRSSRSNEATSTRSCQATRFLRTSMRTWRRAGCTVSSPFPRLTDDPTNVLKFHRIRETGRSRRHLDSSSRLMRISCPFFAETERRAEDRRDRAGCDRMHRRAEACTATSRPLRR